MVWRLVNMLLLLMAWSVNLIVLSPWLIALGIINRLTARRYHRWLMRSMYAIYHRWCLNNNLLFDLFLPTQWLVQGQGVLDKHRDYIVVLNHRSWLDILVIMKVFVPKLPIVKFFLKKSLVFLPFLGQVCWALDYPFINRQGKHQQDKTDQVLKQLSSIEKGLPMAMVIFPEGTRFRSQKPGGTLQNCLPPRCLGLAKLLQATADRQPLLLDVTLHYSSSNLLAFFTGTLEKITVDYQVSELDPSWYGDYAKDRAFRQVFKDKVNTLWQQKDQRYQQIDLSVDA